MGIIDTYKSEEGGSSRKMIKSENDASLMTPIIKVILPLPKYQKVIKDLRRATSSQVGVASFVTGKDSGEIIDAIMRAAFPSDNGQVYMGDRWGYNLDASSFFGKDPQQASAKFKSMLYGNQQTYSAEDVKRLEGMKEKFIGTDGKANPDLANMAIQSIIGGGAPAAAPGGFGPVAAPASNLQATLDNVKKFKEIRDLAIDNLTSIDRIANEKEYRQWVNIKHQAEAQLKALPVPKFYDDLGGAVYDKSGFIDFEIKKVSTVVTHLDSLVDPAKLNAAIDSMAVSMSKEGSPINAGTLSQSHRKAIAQNLILKITLRLESMKVGGKPGIVDIVNKIDAILKQGYDTVIKRGSELKTYRDDLAKQMKGQQKVWIVQNVTDSGLVSGQHGTDNGQGATPQFLDRADLKSTMAKKDTVSGGRCILFVSAESVNYGFDAVPEITLPSGVDEDEADAILSFFKERWESRMKEAGVKPEDMPQHMMMRLGDRDTLKMLITGVTHKEAIRRLNEAFEIAYDDKNIKLDGKKMKDAVTQISNDYASKSAGGGSKGITFMEAKMDWQDYIYENDDKFGWGKFCDNTLEKITQAKQLWDLEAMYRVKLEAAQVKKDVVAIKKIGRKLSQIAGQAKQFLNMPHFLILFGEAASGKSSFAEAFANLMGFKMANVDISQAKGKFAGDTETQTKAILEAMKNMSNVVIRMDEVDGQMPSNESAAINSHEGSMVSQLLSFFNDNVALMDHRNIFVVATTNNPGNVRSQMLSRGQPKEVPCPYGKVGYMKWLSTAPDRLKRQYGRNNFIYGDFKWHGKDYAIANATESSAFVNEAWATIDLDAVADSLVAKGEGLKIDFRSLATLFQDIFVQFNSYVWTQLISHSMWVNNKQEYADDNPAKCTVPGDPNSCPEPVIVGFDLTTEHVVACVNKTVSRQVGGFGTRTDGTNKITTNGSESHAEHMSNERNKAKGKGIEQGLLFTDDQMFQKNDEGEDEDLLTPAGKPSGTGGMEASSTNHFFNALVKDGLISWDGKKAFITPTAPVAPGVMKADIKPMVTSQPESSAPRGRKTLAERIGTYRVGNAILAPVDKRMIL